MTAKSYSVYLVDPEDNNNTLHLCNWHGTEPTAAAFKSVFSAINALPEEDNHFLRRLALGKAMHIDFINANAGEVHSCFIKMNKLLP